MGYTVMNDLKRLTIKGIFIVIVFGTLWHFVYELTGKNFIIGLFFPVSESIWEHMKLCFFPMSLYALYMNKKLKKQYPCITSALLLGILTGTFSIPVIFYTYSGILGFQSLFLDMTTFIVSVLLAFLTAYKLSSSNKLASYQTLLKALILILLLCFLVFSYYPPSIGLFTDPEANMHTH